MLAVSRSARPHWYGVPARALFVTFLLTLLSFAVTLFVTILAMVVAAALRHTTPNLPFAYRHVAFPVALGVGSMVLLVSLVVEIRQLRQARALEGIARASRQDPAKISCP
ncbi:MAG TPA: hypothetical protein VK466_16615 [Terriglobales bacterium]|nr:hypothetical protein [Terriglobales bacterium]